MKKEGGREDRKRWWKGGKEEDEEVKNLQDEIRIVFANFGKVILYLRDVLFGNLY